MWCRRSSRTINPANCCATITLKGRKRAPGHLMSKGCVRRPAKRRGAVAVSLAFEPTCIPSATDLPVLLPIAHAPAKVAH